MPATKDQIADVFSRHVEHFGYGKASVEEVAAELGISKRTIYQHFSSKRDIYAYVVERVGASERLRLLEALEPEPTYRAKMVRFLTLVIDGMRDHIRATSKADWAQEFEIAYDAMARAYGAVGAELIGRGSAAGEFEFDDAALASGMLAATIAHYGTLVREDVAYDADGAVIAAVMRMLGGPCARVDKGVE